VFMRLPHLIAIVCLLSGCRSGPEPTDYITPAHLISQIGSADHIVVECGFARTQDAPKFASFTTTITGHELKKIVGAISSLRLPKPPPGFIMPMSDCIEEWNLEFYRGTEIVGTAHLGDCLVLCDGVEYHRPEILKRLYNRIARESGEED
jgi:hypothetical protein